MAPPVLAPQVLRWRRELIGRVRDSAATRNAIRRLTDTENVALGVGMSGMGRAAELARKHLPVQECSAMPALRRCGFSSCFVGTIRGAGSGRIADL